MSIKIPRRNHSQTQNSLDTYSPKGTPESSTQAKKKHFVVIPEHGTTLELRHFPAKERFYAGLFGISNSYILVAI